MATKTDPRRLILSGLRGPDFADINLADQAA